MDYSDPFVSYPGVLAFILPDFLIISLQISRVTMPENIPNEYLLKFIGIFDQGCSEGQG